MFSNFNPTRTNTSAFEMPFASPDTIRLIQLALSFFNPIIPTIIQKTNRLDDSSRPEKIRIFLPDHRTR